MDLTNKPMRSGGVISAMILALTSLPVVVYAADREIEDCLLYTSDAADDSLRVDLGGRRIIKKYVYLALPSVSSVPV